MGAVSLGVIVDMWKQLPLTPPGFAELLAIELGPPPLEDVDSLVGVPHGAWLDLTSLEFLWMTSTQNTSMGSWNIIMRPESFTRCPCI